MEIPGKSRRTHALKPGDLAAIALAPGHPWPDLIREVWDAGAAVLPIDHRLPPAAVQRLLAAARPAAIFDGSWWPQFESRPAGDEAAVAVATGGTTGGTTGEPKIAVLSHRAVEAAVRTSAARLGAGPDDSWLACLPFGHIGGLLVVLRAVILGAPVTIHPAFDPAALAAANASYTSLVPAMLARLLDAGADLSRFDAILLGGQATPAPLRERAEAAGARIVETYGQTESCGGVVYDGVPLDGTEMRLADGDMIELRGPTVMRGYLGAGGQPFTVDGWLRTGDAGVIEQGRLIRAERAGDVIVSGGEKIYPSQVEDVLIRHPEIADAVVAARPDPAFGSKVVAFIVCPDAVLSLEEVRDFVAAHLPRYAAPREVIVVPEVPRTPGGKIRRHLL
ncbi:MAG TPA: fatty acid--CoA ligase family protein [Actinomycetota bacterium]|nr:fatty acid--CoA ligase family protein [Actinomycetota bacterium]